MSITARVEVTNNFAAIMARLERNAQAVCNEMAAQAGSDIAKAVEDHGGSGMVGRTGASAASIYLMFGTKSGFTSNYGEAISAMRELLEGEIVGDYDRRKKYGHKLSALATMGLEHRLELPRVSPKVTPGSRWAAVASCSRVVWWWETGHHNKFTGMFEYDPVFALVPQQMAGEFVRRMQGALHRTASASATIQRAGRLGAGTRGNRAQLAGKPSARGMQKLSALERRRGNG